MGGALKRYCNLVCRDGIISPGIRSGRGAGQLLWEARYARRFRHRIGAAHQKPIPYYYPGKAVKGLTARILIFSAN